MRGIAVVYAKSWRWYSAALQALLKLRVDFVALFKRSLHSIYGFFAWCWSATSAKVSNAASFFEFLEPTLDAFDIRRTTVVFSSKISLYGNRRFCLVKPQDILDFFCHRCHIAWTAQVAVRQGNAIDRSKCTEKLVRLKLPQVQCARRELNSKQCRPHMLLLNHVTSCGTERQRESN